MTGTFTNKDLEKIQQDFANEKTEWVTDGINAYKVILKIGRYVLLLKG